jgi:formate-dependent nitrite reductase membrane component NrfD
MPDSFVTKAPEWLWWIAIYFFVGGIAGGSFVIAALLQLFGNRADRPLVRAGYIIGFLGSVLSGLVLTIDLRQPLRFWHMLIQSKTFLPAFKYWSPMSFGSWGLLTFGLFSFLATVGTLAEAGYLPRGLHVLVNGPLGWVVNIIGMLAGFFLAGYTGVLLAVTNRPLWSNTVWLGLLFLLSGFSTAGALLLLLGWRAQPSTLHWVEQIDTVALVLELVVLVITVLSLGTTVTRLVLFNVWGVLLILVALAGILLPLALRWRPLLGRVSVPSAAVLVLIGGFLLRIVILFASEAV